jgi:hypothetical protein
MIDRSISSGRARAALFFVAPAAMFVGVFVVIIVGVWSAMFFQIVFLFFGIWWSGSSQYETEDQRNARVLEGIARLFSSPWGAVAFLIALGVPLALGVIASAIVGASLFDFIVGYEERRKRLEGTTRRWINPPRKFPRFWRRSSK